MTNVLVLAVSSPLPKADPCNAGPRLGVSVGSTTPQYRWGFLQKTPWKWCCTVISSNSICPLRDTSATRVHHVHSILLITAQDFDFIHIHCLLKSFQFRQFECLELGKIRQGFSLFDFPTISPIYHINYGDFVSTLANLRSPVPVSGFSSVELLQEKAEMSQISLSQARSPCPFVHWMNMQDTRHR